MSRICIFHFYKEQPVIRCLCLCIFVLLSVVCFLFSRFFPVACVEEIWNYYKADIFDDLRKGQCKDLLKKVKLYMPFYSWTFDEIRLVK